MLVVRSRNLIFLQSLANPQFLYFADLPTDRIVQQILPVWKLKNEGVSPGANSDGACHGFPHPQHAQTGPWPHRGKISYLPLSKSPKRSDLESRLIQSLNQNYYSQSKSLVNLHL